MTENGPAQAGGVQPGDVILSFDGKAVTDMRHLPRLVAETPVDKSVPVTVWRKRQQNTVQVKVGRLDETEQIAAKETPKKATPKEDGGTVTTLGLTLSDITPELKEKFSLADEAKGVVVVDVVKDSPAAEKGLKAGDVIMEAAQEEIKSATQVAGKIESWKRRRKRSKAPPRSPARSTTPSAPAANRSSCWSSARAICASSPCASTRAEGRIAVHPRRAGGAKRNPPFLGWHHDGLRCAPPALRSNDFVLAVALGVEQRGQIGVIDPPA